MNGKCKITINGQVVDLRFGLPANRLFWKGLDQYPDALVEDQLNETGIAILLHAGYVNACLVNDTEQTYKRGAFIEYVEDAQLDETLLAEMRAAVKCYDESAHTKNFGDKMSKALEDVKKKVLTLTRSNVFATENSVSPQSNTKPVRSGSTGSGSKAGKGSSKRKKK